MKKILIAIFAAALLTTSATANDRDHQREYRNNDNTGSIIAGVLGVIIVESILTKRRDREYYDEFEYRQEEPTRCFKTWGRDHYGRPIRRLVCNR